MTEYKLFPGCVIQNRIPYIEASAKWVFEKVGIAHSPAEFGCCPNPVGMKFVDEKAWCTLAARNIVEAEKENKPILSLCNGCYQSLKVADYEMKHDPILKDQVNKVLSKVGKTYQGIIDINHFVTILYEQIGVEKIKSMVTKPLTKLKVALHPGCHYARPSHIIKGEDPMKLKYLRELVEAVGATVVDYDLELLCCGNSVRQADEYTANTMLREKCLNAIDKEADAFVVNCPSCYQQFDTMQKKLNKMDGADPNVKIALPTLYITEMLALAMGQNDKDINLRMHRTNFKAIMEKLI